MKRRLLILLLMTPVTMAFAAHAEAPIKTQWGTVSEPHYPRHICATLSADIESAALASHEEDGDTHPDTARIQQAIDACPSGAVKLVTASGNDAFLSGPITLKSNVVLWIDKGATLYASRDPADYDKGPGDCGIANSSSVKSCRSLIEGTDLVDSGLMGEGRIDGQGGSLLLSGPNAGKRSWWDVAYQSKQGLTQHNFRLVQIDGGQNFTLYKLTFANSPNFHIVPQNMTGITAWGIKILTPTANYTQPNYACPEGTTPDKLTPATCFTPETVKNTDGFDPAQSSNVLLAYSYISTGDDNVAIKSKGDRRSQNHTYARNWFYYGHGMSLGSETDSGMDNIIVTDLVMDGMDSTGGNGLRIKSDSSRGGKVTRVTFDGVCMRNMRNPIVLDTAYSEKTGALIPDFAGVTIRNFRYTGSARFNGGRVVFRGYDAGHPLKIELDNIKFDGPQPVITGSHDPDSLELPKFTQFRLWMSPISFADQLHDSDDVKVLRVVADHMDINQTPRNCHGSFKPLRSVIADSPF